jgi:simple sugar transport system ATP-binding protein
VAPVLAAQHISMAFGSVQANRDVDFSVGPGEIVGLLGENGAGKSTLLSILSGYLPPDAGRIEVSGREMAFRSPGDALAAGVGLVHQHLALVPAFTVREQLTLAGWKSRHLPPFLAGDFSGDELIASLVMGQRQRVEVAKVLVSSPRVLLLDEPTSILAPSEVGSLFALLEEIRRDGTAIVLVTHKLREVMTLVDRIEVMAQGEVAGSFARHHGNWHPGTEDAVLVSMFGRDATPIREAMPERRPRVSTPEVGTAVLSATNLAAPATAGGRAVRDISFELVAGQIHTVAGVDGQGQTELAELICGYRHGTGSLTFDGTPVLGLTALERAEMGLAMLVDDRLGEAGIGSFSTSDNLILKRPRPAGTSRWGILRTGLVGRRSRDVIERWDIRPTDPAARFDTLSGGNMQRVLLARELMREPRLLVGLNPVQGLDARTTAMVWSHLRAMCDAGGTALVFTTDLDEALAEGDRVAIIFEGRLSPFCVPGTSEVEGYASMMVNGW